MHLHMERILYLSDLGFVERDLSIGAVSRNIEKIETVKRPFFIKHIIITSAVLMWYVFSQSSLMMKISLAEINSYTSTGRIFQH